MADEEEALLSMLSLNFYHAVFHLTSILIPPLQKLSRAKSHTHPNYSPYSEYTEAPEQIIRAIRLVANQPGICLTLGDFNAPHINWQTGSCSVSNGFSLKLVEVAEEEFLFQAIKSPTRFREGNNPSLLDLAFTKYPDDVSSVRKIYGVAQC